MAKKARKAVARKSNVKPHKLSEEQKMRWKLRGPHPQTGKSIVCKYDPATGQWDDCSTT
jgi:hypothetical protein